MREHKTNNSIKKWDLNDFILEWEFYDFIYNFEWKDNYDDLLESTFIEIYNSLFELWEKKWILTIVEWFSLFGEFWVKILLENKLKDNTYVNLINNIISNIFKKYNIEITYNISLYLKNKN